MLFVVDAAGVLIFSEEGNRGGLERGSDHCRSDTLKDCLTQGLLDNPGWYASYCYYSFSDL